jgi:AcrR family transcriptional regulator
VHDLVVADHRPALRGAAAAQGDEATCRLIERAELRRIHALGRYLAVLATAQGRAFPPGIVPDDLAIALLRLADGLAGRGQLRPDLLGARIHPQWAPGTWSVFGFELVTLLLGLTVPAAAPAAPPSWSPCPVGDDRVEPGDGISAAALRYLDAGAALALGGGRADGPGGHPDDEGSLRGLGITIAELARASGTSRRALYRVWHDQAEMRRDVFAHLFHEHWREDMAAVGAGLLATVQHGTPDPDDLVLSLSSHLFVEYCHHPDLVQVQIAYPHLREQRVREHLGSVLGVEWTWRAAAVERTFTALGRSFPSTADADLAGHLFAAHADAAIRMVQTTPWVDGRVLTFRSGTWPLFAVTSELLVGSLLSPKGDEAG